MARAKKFDDRRVMTSVRIPQSLYKKLIDIAEERDTSVNHLLVKAADWYIKRLPPLDVEP